MQNNSIPVKDVISTVTDIATEVEQTLETPATTKEAKLSRWLSFAGILIKAVASLFVKKS